MKVNLTKFFTLLLIATSSIIKDDINASELTNSENIMQESLWIHDIHIAIDFDGERYYYIQLADQKNVLSSWELASETHFRTILKDNWEKGDLVTFWEDQFIFNLSKNSKYPFYSAGNWWPQRRQANEDLK